MRQKKIKRKPLKSLQLKDDFLFGELMLDEDICREVLEIILGRPVERIVINSKEETVSGGYMNKGIRLDVFMKDVRNIHYDVEMQIRDQHNLTKRIRHYQAVCDVRILSIGEVDYNKLPESHIIFICTFDQFGRGRYCYTFENRCVEELDLPLGDGTKKIILNTKGVNDDETRPELVEFLKMVEDMDSVEPTDRRMKHIKQRAIQIKETEGMEEKYMLGLIRENEIRFEEREEGRMEGKEEGKAEGKAEGLLFGKQQSICDLLEELGDIPDSLSHRIQHQNDADCLKRWLCLAARSNSIEEFIKLTR